MNNYFSYSAHLLFTISKYMLVFLIVEEHTQLKDLAERVRW